jgi:UDP-N-acetylglucosamine 1-carboxyvinyltransferase
LRWNKAAKGLHNDDGSHQNYWWTPLKGRNSHQRRQKRGLPLMAACLLSEQPLTLTNVPNLADVVYMADVLRQLGVAVTWQMSGPDHVGGTLRLQAPKRPQSLATYDAVRKMRASFLVLGPLVAREPRSHGVAARRLRDRRPSG